MLKAFRVNNFRSLVNVEFRPTGLNLLLGPNNAGKTNLCSGLRFVGLSSIATLETAARQTLGETWNITNVYVTDSDLEFEIQATLNDGDQDLEFAYLLRLNSGRDSRSARQSLTVSREVLTVTGGGFSKTDLLRNVNGQAHLLHERRFLGQQPGEHYVATLSPSEATMLSRLFDLETNRRANLFKSYLKSWLYYNLTPHMLRSSEVVLENPVIRHDGANLSKVLFTLHNQHPRLERRIINAVKELEPKLDLFTYNSPDPESVYLFLEDELGHRFSTQSMSDGTLRYLAMAYLVHTAADAPATGGGPSAAAPSTAIRPLVLIEEPENGLYVGYLRSLLASIEPSGAAGQFVFTSHSPYFIDLFEKNLDGVHLLKPGRPSSVLVKPDPDRIKPLLDQMPLGELHFREMLA